MSVRKRVFTCCASAGVLLFAGMGAAQAAASHTPAQAAVGHAAQHRGAGSRPDFDGLQVCGNGGSGYCLNDWNGSIGDIKMYYGGYDNDEFSVQPLGLCGGTVQDSNGDYCPFNSASIASKFKGDEIMQLQSGVNPEYCLGSAQTNSSSIMQECNVTSTGTGGGYGTVLIRDTQASCGTGSPFVDRYWTNKYNTAEYVESGGSIGSQANLDYSQGGPTCWG